MKTAIIDAHAHVVQCIAGFGSKGELRACGEGKAVHASGEVIQMIPDFLGEYDATPEKVLALMDAEGVGKTVLLQGSYFGFQNEYTAAAVRRYPDRFVGAATWDPFCREKARVISYLLDELGFRIVKFEVSTGSGLMSYHPTLELDGEVMEELYTLAESRGLIFVIDIGRRGTASAQVEALRRAVLRHPNLRFVVCHLLAPLLADEAYLAEGLKRLALPNVSFDLAALPANTRPESWPYPTAQRFLGLARNLVGADRLLWGSDLPSTLTRDTYRHLVDYVEQSGAFNDAELELVLRTNAEQLYFSGA